jgi:carboxypeptidase C (cathepsin A)
MQKKLLLSLSLLGIIMFTGLFSFEEKAETKTEKPPTNEIKEEIYEAVHTIKINGTPITYKSSTGTLVLKDDNGKAKASIFFVAYTKQDVNNISNRPVTFCFNGGPGSSAVWLHIGVLGPKRIVLNADGCVQPPYQLIDNEFSILDSTDLVFIDPVSTGFSRAAPGEDSKQYHGFDADISSVAEFIRLYTTKYNRWESPKFLTGESYGTTRAAYLVNHLHDVEYMYFNGVILISSILNFQTISANQGNDLPYMLFLPSYTAAAWYHKKLPSDLQSLTLEEALKQSQDFATDDYNFALLKGDLISEEDKKATVDGLARFTGLTPEYLQRANLRVSPMHYTKELLRADRRTIGRFDSRLKGYSLDLTDNCMEYDPSLEAIAGGFTATFNYYVHNDLKWPKDENYKILADVSPWNYGKGANNQYLNVADNLQNVITKNPYLHIFVASGYYDLATPYFATDYTFNHLGIDPALRTNITMKNYDGGHMMYLLKPSLIKLSQDMTAFINSTCHSNAASQKQPERRIH